MGRRAARAARWLAACAAWALAGAAGAGGAGGASADVLARARGCVDADGGEVGGWGCPASWRATSWGAVDAGDGGGPCTVDRVPASLLSAADFADRYLGVRPVVVVFGAGWNAKARALTTREAVLRDHGHRNVTLSDATTYSPSSRKVRVSVSEYVASFSAAGAERRYLFGDHGRDEWANVFDVFQRPPYGPDAPGAAGSAAAVPHWAYSFGLGERGSGVPFHVHGGGWSECLHGSKRWFLYEDGVVPRFEAEMATADWVAQVYPDLAPRPSKDTEEAKHLERMVAEAPDEVAGYRPLECTIVPGEALYFPPGWYHATLNTQEGAFISTFL